MHPHGSSETKTAAPILNPILVGLRVAGSAVLGTASLITEYEQCKYLSEQVDKDLAQPQKQTGRSMESNR